MDLLDQWIVLTKHDLQNQNCQSVLRKRLRKSCTTTKKAKFSVTPPSSPTSFSANPNVFNNNSFTPSPRLASDDTDGGVDGFFKFLGDDYPDVFTISNGNVNNDTLSRPQKPPQSPKAESREGTLPGNRGSNFSEDKYKWNDTDTCANTDKTKKTKKSRKICLIVLVILLVLALIGVGLAVILVYKVFDVGEAEEVVGPTTESPEILTLEGSLDLKATWTIELSDKNSTLFKSTAENFTKEIDRLMEDSPYNESYISTTVIEMSKGSIQFKYRMSYNSQYKRKARTGPEFAVLVEDHIKRKSTTSELPIVKDTIEIYVKLTTPSSTSTSSVTPSTISTPVSTTSSSMGSSTLSSSSSSSSSTENLPLSTSSIDSSNLSSSSSMERSTSISAAITTSSSMRISTLSSLSTSSSTIRTTSTTTNSMTSSMPVISTLSARLSPNIRMRSKPLIPKSGLSAYVKVPSKPVVSTLSSTPTSSLQTDISTHSESTDTSTSSIEVTSTLSSSQEKTISSITFITTLSSKPMIDTTKSSLETTLQPDPLASTSVIPPNTTMSSVSPNSTSMTSSNTTASPESLISMSITPSNTIIPSKAFTLTSMRPSNTTTSPESLVPTSSTSTNTTLPPEPFTSTSTLTSNTTFLYESHNSTASNTTMLSKYVTSSHTTGSSTSPTLTPKATLYQKPVILASTLLPTPKTTSRLEILTSSLAPFSTTSKQASSTLNTSTNAKTLGETISSPPTLSPNTATLQNPVIPTSNSISKPTMSFMSTSKSSSNLTNHWSTNNSNTITTPSAASTSKLFILTSSSSPNATTSSGSVSSTSVEFGNLKTTFKHYSLSPTTLVLSSSKNSDSTSPYSSSLVSNPVMSGKTARRTKVDSSTPSSSSHPTTDSDISLTATSDLTTPISIPSSTSSLASNANVSSSLSSDGSKTIPTVNLAIPINSVKTGITANTTASTPSSTTTSASTSSTTTPSTTTPSTTTSSTTTSSTTTQSTTTSSTTTPSTTTPSTTTSSTTTTSTTTSTTTTPSTTTTSTTTPSTTTSSTTTSSTTTSTPSTSTTTVPDNPPTANAGPDVEVTLPASSVELDGSSSTDDHGIVSYSWESVTPLASVKLEGTNNVVLRITNLVSGVFRFRLTVTDNAGQTSEDTVLVNIKPEPTTTTTSTTITTTPSDLCVRVNLTTCRDLGFEMTVRSNLFGHATEEDAITSFNLMSQSVHNQVCQDVALTYICSLHFPQCNPASGYMVFPCKSLCTTAVTTCDDYFNNPFDCSYFDDADCVSMSTTTPAPTTPVPAQLCELTFHKECLELGFNETQFPNFINELKQSEANVTFSYFGSDLEPLCHKDALFFICSVQFPKCVNGRKQKPCRRTCKSVAGVCEIIGLFMTCENFPEIDCIAPPEPVPECGKDEFTCNSVSKCVYQDKVCNGVNDCGDYSDEMDCTCDEHEFQCTMGMCIKSYQKCDGTAQCPDSSDENKDECGNCTHGQVQCPDGKCIMAEWMCDDRAECSDGWDEFNCDICKRNQFMCKDRNRTCIPIEKACDQVPDCPDGYDEWSCIKDGKGFLQLRYKKQWMSVCSDYWDDQFGDYTCTELLGKGNYIGKTDIVQNVYKYIKLGSGSLQSVLGPIDLTSDCQSRKVVKVNCEARGCGKQMFDVESKIVNGEVASKGAWPWHVALYFAGQYFCGGTLINENFVLTAAHCVDGVVYSDHSRMTVKLGANNREQWETTQHVIRVEAIESHSEHVYFKKNDIALLQLESPVNFTDYIQPVCLPERGDPLPLYSTCFTVGWGKTKWDGEYAEVLQQLKMTLWDTQKCNSSVAWDGEVYDTFLCAGYYSGIRSICKGDSGGPLLCMDKSETWKIFGVASYVANFCNMTERPNIYTNVTQLLPWIAEKTECKFRCDNGKCLYYKDLICNRVDDCGDNSDEIRPCNRTVSCTFEDKYLCGYNFSGWNLAHGNKQAASVQIDGQWHTQSNAPQYDYTFGGYPGRYFYGKTKEVRDAELLSPWFNVSGQTCIRFSYYQRGEIKLGLTAQVRWSEVSSDTTTPWSSGAYYAVDEWKTGFFDLNLGRYQVIFKTGDLLKTAIDDVMAIPGMCENVLCSADEFRCKGPKGDAEIGKCIPKRSRCNLAIDCDDFEYNRESDEKSCTALQNNYKCTFDNGNLCALHQEVGDASDWWLVNASFVRKETGNKKFVDHTKSTEEGRLFYINAYGLQTSKHITMWQMFYLHSRQYCFSFFYQMKSNVTFNIHVDCNGCVRDTHVAQSTFDDNWTLWQLNLPSVEVVNITYDVVGNSLSEGFFRSFIALDDIYMKEGVCPDYECRPNYTKCRSYDRCIPQAALCNRTVDCLDESDEDQCECTKDEFKCLSGRCISKDYLCDRTPQCLDKSDEGDVCLPLQNVTCTFEHPYMCGYDLVRTTEFHWQRYKGQTPTPVTGPKADHTSGTPEGYYMYTEANQGSKNDSASLLSPIFNSQVGRSVRFFYHMYSSQWYDTRAGLLELSFEDMEKNVVTDQWQAPVNDLHDYWREVCISLPDNVNMRLIFTSMRTEQSHYGTDNAIDDVSVSHEPCTEVTGSTMRTTSSTAGGFACGSGQWMCADSMCIDENYKCDGYGDCNDSSDEWDCPGS